MHASFYGLPPGAVVICHSEPGAWHPAMYSTSRCPPLGNHLPSLSSHRLRALSSSCFHHFLPGASFTIGRTMFETDRIPSGWVRVLFISLLAYELPFSL